MDALNAQNSAQRLYNVIYSNVLIIILCSLYDRLALHMLHISDVLFKVIPIIFQAFQNHHGEQRTSEVSKNSLFIGLKISGKFSYRADNR